jgi:hypothetical protein
MSRDQASLLHGLASKIVRMSPRLSDAIVCRDGSKQLLCPAKGTVYRELSAEASTAWGSSPVFVVHDEVGLVRGPRSELFEALETDSAACALECHHHVIEGTNARRRRTRQSVPG